MRLFDKMVLQFLLDAIAFFVDISNGLSEDRIDQSLFFDC